MIQIQPYSSIGGKLGDIEPFDFSKASYPQMSVFLNYRLTILFLKVPTRLLLSHYAFAGVGAVVSNQNDLSPAFNFGIGQNFYFTKRFSASIDIGVYTYYGPAMFPLYLGLKGKQYEDLKAKVKEKSLNSSTIVSLGLSFFIINKLFFHFLFIFLDYKISSGS